MTDPVQACWALLQAGRAAEAEARLRPMAEASPDHPGILHLLGLALRRTGRSAEALTHFARAADLAPGQSQPLIDLGEAFMDLGRAAEAGEAFTRAERLGHPLAAAGLCGALIGLDRFDDAAEAGARAIAAAPRAGVAYYNAASALMQGGRVREAQGVLERGVVAAPEYPALVFALLAARLYEPTFPPAAIREEHRRAGAWLASLCPARRAEWALAPDPERPLRVGVLSSDLRSHSVGRFVEPWLRGHDRERYPVTAYQTVAGDTRTEVLRPLASAWVDAGGLSDVALLERIRADRIDVLIELNGHTNHHRAGVLLQRAAPVQWTYLGYAGPSGLPTIDGRVVDAWTDPVGAGEPGADGFAIEPLVRLPRCFLAFAAPDEAPPVGPLPGLAAGSPLTLGCFSTLCKIDPAVLAWWGELLERHPLWRLVMKNRGLRDPRTAARVLDTIAGARPVRDRVELVGFTRNAGEHLGMYGRVDVALDAQPYAGTTTTCEALWMGVPTVVMPSPGHHGRVGVSILTAVGLTDWIATDRAAAERLIERWDADRAGLAAVRAGLRARMAASALMDGAGLARALEGAVRERWRWWCATGA